MALAARKRSGIAQPAALPTPQASVIIPTHNRRHLLEMTLERLAHQTVDLSTVEVIVVADGCHDDTVDMLRVCSWPFSLRVLQHSQRGSGASRNAAAAVAQAPVLIFLDDDVMAAPELIERHLAAHREGLPAVAIGRGGAGWKDSSRSSTERC
jgi:glycosyltransferase involved in cell wall biosynthesis